MNVISPRKNRLATWGIIAIMIALVSLPVLIKTAPLELAKWYLAAAANAVSSQNWNAAEELLSKSEEISPDIRLSPDYWGVYLRLNSNNPEGDDSAASLIEKLKEAIGENSENRLAGNWLVELLSEQGRFSEALDTMKLTLGEAGARGAIQLNQLAYHRSLAKQELEQALEDIDKALQEIPDEPSFLDTKAWILFKQGKSKEALPLVDKAVERFLQLVPANLQRAPEDYDPAGLGTAPLGKLPDDAPQDAIKAVAVIRYHRLKILESLGEDERALEDYRTIRYWGFEPSDKLY